MQLSTALNPSILDLENYELMFHIPHILLKPGLSLASEAYYLIMTGRGHNMTAKDHTINISIVEKLVDGEKENDKEVDQEKSKDKGKKGCVSLTNFYISCAHACIVSKDPATLPGNMNKKFNIQAL